VIVALISGRGDRALFDDELDALLARVIEQWNIAERRIKKAELVRGGEVVSPAIFELRYAGRKLVDALTLAREKDLALDQRAHDDVYRYLADAYEDCVKAKHDAIDATISFVTVWFQEIEEYIGLRAVQEFFPEYLDITAKISDIQDKIAESREDRHNMRDGVYDEIEGQDYDDILALFDKMYKSKDRIDRQIRKDRMYKDIMIMAAVGGPVLGAIIAVVVAVFQ
jgi:hypothetical protein